MNLPQSEVDRIEKDANEKYYCGGDLPDSVIYEAAAANAAYIDGATTEASTSMSKAIELLDWMFAGATETIPYPGKNKWLRDLSDEYKDSKALYEAFLSSQAETKL